MAMLLRISAVIVFQIALYIARDRYGAETSLLKSEKLYTYFEVIMKENEGDDTSLVIIGEVRSNYIDIVYCFDIPMIVFADRCRRSGQASVGRYSYDIDMF